MEYVYVQRGSVLFVNRLQGIVDDGQRGKRQEIHLQHPGFFQVVSSNTGSSIHPCSICRPEPIHPEVAAK